MPDADERHTCPRRMQEIGPWEHTENLDTWRPDAAGPCCNFCGSLHPDRFMELAEQGWEIGPTDKSYKAYLSEPGNGGPGRRAGKFYFQHLSEQQCDQFVRLYNEHQMNVGYPGYFYTPPFFAAPTPQGGAETTQSPRRPTAD